MKLAVVVLFLIGFATANNLNSGQIFDDIKLVNLDERWPQTQVAHQEFSVLANDPTFGPTAAPTTEAQFTSVPSFVPTFQPTEVPTENPTFAPSKQPTFQPTITPTHVPTFEPTEVPTEAPTEAPTAAPTYAPTAAPTFEPTAVPSAIPTYAPTDKPSAIPTYVPTADPSAIPTFVPTADPTFAPSFVPTATPTFVPSASPTITPAPTAAQVQGVKVSSTNKLSTTATLFNANPINAVVFGKAVDQTLNLTLGTTVVGSAYPATSRRRLQSGSASCIVPYTITLSNTAIIGEPNADAAYNYITNILTTATSSGTLTATVVSLASSSGATILANATVSEYGATYEVVPIPQEHKRLSDGAIAGIVIGTILGVGLLATILYYVLVMRRSDSDEGSVDIDKPEVYRDVTNEAPSHHERSIVSYGGSETRV